MRVMRGLGRLFGAKPAGVLFAAVFLVCAASFGVMHATLVPPGQAGDEQAHAFRGFSVGHGEFTGRRHLTKYPDGTEFEVTSVTIDPILGPIMSSGGNGASQVMTLSDLIVTRYSTWSQQRVPAVVGAIGTYFPLFYLPAALANSAAEPLGLLPITAVQATRFLNLGCFLLLGVVALLVAECSRGLILCVLSLPMAVSLAASLNPDGLLLPTAVLAAALLTRADARPRPGITRPARSWWAAAIALSCVALVKPPYLPMLAALLLPLPGRGEWRRLGSALAFRAAAIALLALPAIAWSAYVVRVVAGVVHQAPYVAGPWWGGAPGLVLHHTDPAAQAAILLADPTRIWQVVRTGVQPLRSVDLIGVLGWLDVALPLWLYGWWSVAIVVAVLSDMFTRRGAGRGPRLADVTLLALAFALTVTVICVSMYLSWTTIGKAQVDGVQARYFLPLMPFLALVLPRVGMPGAFLARGAGLLAPGFVAVVTCAVMPFTLLFSYLSALKGRGGRGGPDHGGERSSSGRTLVQCGRRSGGL